MTDQSVPRPRQVLEGLMAVVAEHDQRDVNGWCLACLRSGTHARHPCAVRERYAMAARRLRDSLARPSG